MTHHSSYYVVMEIDHGLVYLTLSFVGLCFCLSCIKKFTCKQDAIINIITAPSPVPALERFLAIECCIAPTVIYVAI